VYLGGLKWVVLGNRTGQSGFYVNAGWDGLGWAEMAILRKTV